jgi:hypothetical protein
MFFPVPTMKGCAGLVDYYKNSVALPLWSDLSIKVNGLDYEWQFSDRFSQIETHSLPVQATNFVKDYGHIKIKSPWIIKTKENINWVWSKPSYSFCEDDMDLEIVPGITNFSKQFGNNINLLIKLNQNKTYNLRVGQTLVHLTPMTENKIEIVRHLISEEEHEKIKYTANMISFVNKYKKIDELKQKFSNCPYNKKD